MPQVKRAKADLSEEDGVEFTTPLCDRHIRGLLGYNLKRAYMAFAPRNHAALSQFGLKVQSFACLSLIDENTDLAPSQVAQYLRIERSNLVAILDDMTQKGLILRERAIQDRRRIALRLTQDGQSVLQSAQQALAQIETAVLSALTPQECTILTDLLARIESNSAP